MFYAQDLSSNLACSQKMSFSKTLALKMRISKILKHLSKILTRRTLKTPIMNKKLVLIRMTLEVFQVKMSSKAQKLPTKVINFRSSWTV